ncbi:MAG: tyrosine--tRNA ligase, partial [Microlunatus sp.]|nr:tyrosine--tRNA ligase [Microlunatus sp.]
RLIGGVRQQTAPPQLVEDAKVVEYLKVFSERPRAEIEELARLTSTEPERRAAQKALADDVTALVHSRQARDAAVQAAASLFGRGSLDEVPADVLADAVTEIGARSLPLEPRPSLLDVLVTSGVLSSRSAARRAVAEGGAYVNNVRVSDPDAALAATDVLHDRFVVARRGKRTVGAVVLTRG